MLINKLMRVGALKASLVHINYFGPSSLLTYNYVYIQHDTSMGQRKYLSPQQ